MYPKAATFDIVARLQSPTFCWHEYCFFFFFTSVRPSPFSSFSVECVSFFSVGWSDGKKTKNKKQKKKKPFIEITRILRIGGLKPQHHCRGTCKHNPWLLPNQHELSMVEYGRKLYDGRFHSFIYFCHQPEIQQQYTEIYSILKIIYNILTKLLTTSNV